MLGGAALKQEPLNGATREPFQEKRDTLFHPELRKIKELEHFPRFGEKRRCSKEPVIPDASLDQVLAEPDAKAAFSQNGLPDPLKPSAHTPTGMGPAFMKQIGAEHIQCDEYEDID